MHTTSTLELVLGVPGEPDLVEHADSVDVGSSFDEREIEAVSVEGGDDGGFDVLDVFEPAADQGGLRGRDEEAMKRKREEGERRVSFELRVSFRLPSLPPSLPSPAGP